MSRKLTEKITPKETALLMVLADPAASCLPVAEQCKLAGMSRDNYYAAFKRPKFAAAYDQLCRDIIRQAIAPVLQAAAREAKKGSFQDRKIMLEMSGTYQQKAAIDVRVRTFEEMLDEIQPEIHNLQPDLDESIIEDIEPEIMDQGYIEESSQGNSENVELCDSNSKDLPKLQPIPDM